MGMVQHTDTLPAHHGRPGAGLVGLQAARFSVLPDLERLQALPAGLGLARVSFRHRGEQATEIELPPLPEHVILLRAVGDGRPQEAWIAGRPLRRRPLPGTALLLGLGADARWVKRGATDGVLHLHLAPDWLSRLAAEEGLPAAAARPDLRLVEGDSRMAGLANLLEAERAHGPVTAAFAEHWAVLVALSLLQAPPGPARRAHAIAPRRLAEVKAFIEANLAGDITLADMAAAAGLSRFHFARAFKRDTGLSPHAFLIARRVELARRRLQEEDLPLEAVAAATGFGSTAHLTSAVRRVTGATPAQWRRAARG